MLKFGPILMCGIYHLLKGLEGTPVSLKRLPRGMPRPPVLTASEIRLGLSYGFLSQL